MEREKKREIAQGDGQALCSPGRPPRQLFLAALGGLNTSCRCHDLDIHYSGMFRITDHGPNFRKRSNLSESLVLCYLPNFGSGEPSGEKLIPGMWSIKIGTVPELAAVKFSYIIHGHDRYIFQLVQVEF